MNKKELPNLGLDFAVGSIQVLKILNEINKFEEFIEFNFSIKLQDRLLLGYKLGLLVALHRIIEHFVDSPEDIGISSDEVITNAFHWGSFKDSNIRSLPNVTPHGILINNLLGYRNKIISAKNWNVLKQELFYVIDYIEKLESVIIKFYVGKNDKSNVISPVILMKSKLPQVLLIFFNDSNKLFISYNELIRSFNYSDDIDLRDFNRNLGANPFDIEDPFDKLDKHKIFLNGYKLANLYLWNKVLGNIKFKQYWNIFHKIFLSQSWDDFDSIFGIINENIVKKLKEKDEYVNYYFKKNGRIQKDIIQNIISPYFGLNITNEDKLKALLLFRPIQYINYDVMGAMNFIVVLNGLIFNYLKEKINEKIRIIEITHTHEFTINFTYAILLPLSGIFSDASRWWVFYRCATNMSMETGTYDLIKKTLEDYSDYINIDKIEVDENKLQDYLRSAYVKHIEDKTDEVITINSAMRGALLELLVSNYYSKLGYSIILGHKTRFIKKELDIVAIDENNKIITIIECKEKSVTIDSEEFDLIADKLLDELHVKNRITEIGISHNEVTISQLNDFIFLINKIKKNYLKFIQELKIPDLNYRIKGIFASSELYNIQSIELPEDIEFWTWWEIREKLQSVKMNKRYIEIIEKHMKSSLSPLKNPHFMQDFF